MRDEKREMREGERQNSARIRTCAHKIGCMRMGGAPSRVKTRRKSRLAAVGRTCIHVTSIFNISASRS